jgi:hypothetical protein
MYLFVNMFVCLSVCRSTCLAVCVYIVQSVCLSHLSLCLSTHLPLAYVHLFPNPIFCIYLPVHLASTLFTYHWFVNLFLLLSVRLVDTPMTGKAKIWHWISSFYG